MSCCCKASKPWQKNNGYGVFVCNTQRDLKIEENYLRMMREVQPLGIIYACNPSFSRQVAELSGEIPVVVISNRDDEFSIDGGGSEQSETGDPDGASST